MQTLTLLRPDDMHLHLRDGDTLRHVLPHTARQMGRAVIMPNLKPPVISVADALAYRERILASLPAGSRLPGAGSQSRRHRCLQTLPRRRHHQF